MGGLAKLPDGSPEALAQIKQLQALLAQRGLAGVAAVLPSSSRGFAFVRFNTPPQMRTALTALGENAELGGARLRLSAAKPAGR